MLAPRWAAARVNGCSTGEPTAARRSGPTGSARGCPAAGRPKGGTGGRADATVTRTCRRAQKEPSGCGAHAAARLVVCFRLFSPARQQDRPVRTSRSSFRKDAERNAAGLLCLTRTPPPARVPLFPEQLAPAKSPLSASPVSASQFRSRARATSLFDEQQMARFATLACSDQLPALGTPSLFQRFFSLRAWTNRHGFTCCSKLVAGFPADGASLENTCRFSRKPPQSSLRAFPKRSAVEPVARTGVDRLLTGRSFRAWHLSDTEPASAGLAVGDAERDGTRASIFSETVTRRQVFAAATNAVGPRAAVRRRRLAS